MQVLFLCDSLLKIVYSNLHIICDMDQNSPDLKAERCDKIAAHRSPLQGKYAFHSTFGLGKWSRRVG